MDHHGSKWFTMDQTIGSNSKWFDHCWLGKMPRRNGIEVSCWKPCEYLVTWRFVRFLGRPKPGFLARKKKVEQLIHFFFWTPKPESGAHFSHKKRSLVVSFDVVSGNYKKLALHTIQQLGEMGAERAPKFVVVVQRTECRR